MAETTTHEHEYHLVDPSPWPALAALAAFALAGGLIMFMHDITAWVLVIGILLMLYTMFVWWRDVIREATFEGHHKPIVQLGLRYGMALFIASEVMFFVAWFWAFYNASLFPTAAMGGAWPPQGIETFNPWHLPFVNTLILLTSGTTVTWAHHALRNDDRKGLWQGLVLTVALGITFTIIQGYEFIHAPFTITGGIYGTTFFMATGFHGAHVIIGTIFLCVCLYRAQQGHFKPDHHFGLEAAAWYWHFVDVVWLFLFTSIYVWGR
ncbi:MAG: cytochrome c oxidase subunit 3 [Alphaproteobacteria bacterium]